MRYLADADVKRQGQVAPYLQLVSILRARIARGDWQPHEPIPSEAKLVDRYNLARSTVRRAIQLLVDEEVLLVVPQRGMFVTEHGQQIAEIRQQVEAQRTNKRR